MCVCVWLCYPDTCPQGGHCPLTQLSVGRYTGGRGHGWCEGTHVTPPDSREVLVDREGQSCPSLAVEALLYWLHHGSSGGAGGSCVWNIAVCCSK